MRATSGPFENNLRCVYFCRTDEEFLDYVQSVYYRNTSRAVVAPVLDLYPSDPAAGSPFGTGDEFAYTPQYKRIAAFVGDFGFQAPRRFFVQQLSGGQPVWSYSKHVCMIVL